MLFCCLRRNVDLRLLVINTSPSSPTNNKRRRLLLPAISVRNLPRSGAAMCITLGGRTVDNKRTWWSQILVENLDFTYPTCIWRPVRGSLSDCTMFGTEKLEWCGYTRRWNKFWRYVYSFQQNTSRTWWADRWTDGWTDRHREPSCDSFYRAML